MRGYETQRQGWDERGEAFCSFWNAATEEETRTLNDSHERLMKWLVNFIRVLNTWRVQAHRAAVKCQPLTFVAHSGNTRSDTTIFIPTIVRRIKTITGTGKLRHIVHTYLLQAWLVASWSSVIARQWRFELNFSAFILKSMRSHGK